MGWSLRCKGYASSLPMLFIRDLESYQKVTRRNSIWDVGKEREKEGGRWDSREREISSLVGTKRGRGSTAAASAATMLHLSERNPLSYICIYTFLHLLMNPSFLPHFQCKRLLIPEVLPIPSWLSCMCFLICIYLGRLVSCYTAEMFVLNLLYKGPKSVKNALEAEKK